MKIKLHELIPDRYYISYENSNSNYFYFKYNYSDDKNVYYSYSFIKDRNGVIHFNKSITYYHFTIGWYNSCIVFKECLFIDIVDYLPGTNPDKINYLRQQKIKSLLSL